MEAATEATLMNPEAVIKSLEAQLVVTSAGVKPTVTPMQIQDISPVTIKGEDISGEPSGDPLRDVQQSLTDQKAVAQAKREGKLPRRQPLDPQAPRYRPTVKLPHKESYVTGWMEQQEQLIDLAGGDASAPVGMSKALSDIESEGETQEPMLSEAGSLRTDLNMMRVWIEEQMKDTHEVLAKIQHRLSILEQRTAGAVPLHRPSQSKDITSSPPRVIAGPSTLLAVTPPTKPAPPSVKKSVVNWQDILTRHPFRPILVSQRRMLVKIGLEINMHPKDLDRPLNRSEWTPQGLSPLFT